MTQIVINHCGSVPNVDAMEACIKFVYENYNNRRTYGYRESMELTTNRGYLVRITEAAHPDAEDSPGCAVFDVVKLGKEDG